MPKLIKDAEARIMESAERIFAENGYEKTDMKQIARAAGVAVGTLYNYWPGKKALYDSVSGRQWEETFSSLDGIMHSGVNPQLKAILFIKRLYDHFEGGRGTSRQEDAMRQADSLFTMPEVWEGIQKRTERLLLELARAEGRQWVEADLKRAARTLVLSILSCLDDFPKDKESNIRFVNRLVMSLMRENGKK